MNTFSIKAPLWGMIFFLSLCINVYTNDHKEKHNVCINIDWDGVITEAKEPLIAGFTTKTQLMRCLKVIPKSILISSFFWNIPTLVKALYYNRFYDENGNKLYGNHAHLQALINNAPALAPYCTLMLEQIAQATPLYETITLIQKWQHDGARIIVWTNNDEPMFLAKLRYLNTLLNQQNKKALHLDGYFVAGANTFNANLIGKPCREYYQKAFAYSQSVVGDTETWQHYFIDDNIKNVTAANQFAQQEHIKLIALQHTNPKDFKGAAAQFLLYP